MWITITYFTKEKLKVNKKQCVNYNMKGKQWRAALLKHILPEPVHINNTLVFVYCVEISV
jgi:hypothetical protein